MLRNNAYYYSRLSEAEKTIYKALRTGIESFSREIPLPLATEKEIYKIFCYILLDTPLIFYTPSGKIIIDKKNHCCRFLPNYKYSKHKVKHYANEIVQFLRVFDPVQRRSDLEKELFVHDFCLEHFKYDFSFGEHAHSILGPVLCGTAVCEGIAKFTKVALDYLGVKNLLVYGKAIGQVSDVYDMHTWNIVKIDGQTFHLDVTHDMGQKTSKNRYDYFNLSDDDIQKDHSFISDFISDVPKCVISDKDYYTIHGMTVHSPAELKAYLDKCLRRGEKYITVKLRNVTDPGGIVNRIQDLTLNRYQNTFDKDVVCEVRYNLNQLVFEIELD